MNGINEFSSNHIIYTGTESHKRGIDKLYLLFSIIWGGTLGAAVSQSFHSNTSWLTYSTTAILPINWVIFPFKPWDGYCHSTMKTTEKVIRLAAYTLSMILGYSAPILYNLLSSSDNEDPYMIYTQIGLLLINLFSSYLLKERPSFTERISWYDTAKTFSRPVINIKNHLCNYFIHHRESSSSVLIPKNNLKLELSKRTRILEKQNKELEQKILFLRDFIRNDIKLLQCFKSCLKETQNLLRPFPEMHNSKPVANPILEEWRMESKKKIYLEDLKRYFLEFLRKNPAFCEALQKALNRQQEHDLKKMAIEGAGLIPYW